MVRPESSTSYNGWLGVGIDDLTRRRDGVSQTAAANGGGTDDIDAALEQCLKGVRKIKHPIGVCGGRRGIGKLRYEIQIAPHRVERAACRRAADDGGQSRATNWWRSRGDRPEKN